MSEEGALRVVQDEIVAPGAPWSARLQQEPGVAHRRPGGRNRASISCATTRIDPRERYYAPNTIKKSGTLHLTKGHSLYSGPGTTALHDRSRHLRPSRHHRRLLQRPQQRHALRRGRRAGLPRELRGRPGGTRPGMDGHRAQRELLLRRAGLRREACSRSGPSWTAHPSPAITSTCEPSATCSRSSPTALRSTTRLPGADRPRFVCKFVDPRLSWRAGSTPTGTVTN